MLVHAIIYLYKVLVHGRYMAHSTLHVTDVVDQELMIINAVLILDWDHKVNNQGVIIYAVVV